MESWKRRAVGTPLGRVLVELRHQMGIWRSALRSPEQGGIVFQDIVTDRLLPRLGRPSTLFLDVGAHIGAVLAAVRRWEPSTKLVAVEPIPEKAAYLAQKFPGVEVHCVALGENDGQVDFFVDKKLPGYSSLVQGKRSREDVTKIAVPLRRLDGLLSDATPIDVMKLDVEGAELGVLRGAAARIAASRPVIVFESGPEGGRAFGYTEEELFDWFAARDYQILVPNRVAHDGPPLGREGFVEGHFYPYRTLNYFAIPQERRQEIRDRARAILGVRPG